MSDKSEAVTYQDLEEYNVYLRSDYVNRLHWGDDGARLTAGSLCYFVKQKKVLVKSPPV